jgi:type VI secretion system secreted protein VgrG
MNYCAERVRNCKMAKQVNIEIELEGGTKLSPCMSLTLRQEFGSPHSFEVLLPFEVLEDSKDSFFNKSYETVIGKIITFSIKAGNSGETQNINFKGIVTSIELKGNNAFNPYFSLVGASTDGLLKDGRQRRTFVKQTLKQVYDKVLDSYPQNLLKRKIKLEDNPSIEYVVQYDETNYDFLKRVAQEHGNWFYYNGQELIIGSKEDDAVDFRIDGIQNYDMSISITPSRFGVYNYDYVNDNETSGISKDQKLTGLNQLVNFALKASENSFSQDNQIVTVDISKDSSGLNDYVKLSKTMHAGNLVFFNGIGENCGLTLGKVVSVKEIRYNDDGSNSEEDLGKYRITGITHSVDANGCYSNQFTAIPETLPLPPVYGDLHKPIGNIEIAEVVDNKDPEKIGRVKVKFYWQNNDAESVWIRVSTLYSGTGKGILFTPEVGAQIIVGYQHGDPSQPVMLGSLYPKTDGESYTSDSNNLKMIQTRGGNYITFDDTDNEQRIILSNENNDKTTLSLSFKNDGSIEIKTQGSLSLEGKDISIKSQTLKIEADQTIEMEAQQGTKIKSAQFKVDANASLEMATQGSLKIEGAMVDVEGQAMINMKAGIIKLN